MRVRSIVAGLATTAVAVSTASLVALAPAHADPSFTPDANDIVGVGSDTSENVMDNLADGIPGTAGYNGGKTAADARLVSWDTEGTAQITPRAGATAINRPVGSGAGKALLFGASNNPDITFARSSSAENATEVAGGLQSFPFALDTLSMAVSGTVKSHAPASLTGAQIVSIFKGDVTNWNQVGGKAGTIKPFVPQAGSGTRSFFEAQLTNLNGGTPVVYGPGVDTNMHENTDTVLASDPNAVAPFSVGKANTLFPTTVHLEGGFSAQRALYNVVRGADVADATITGIFGSAGFICSPAATRPDRGSRLPPAGDSGPRWGVWRRHAEPDLQPHHQQRAHDHPAGGQEHEGRSRRPRCSGDGFHGSQRHGLVLRGRHPDQVRHPADLGPGDPVAQGQPGCAHLQRAVHPRPRVGVARVPG